MATLWALTGTLDPRPMQDSKVSDIVNDESKVSKFRRSRGVRSDVYDSLFNLYLRLVGTSVGSWHAQ